MNYVKKWKKFQSQIIIPQQKFLQIPVLKKELINTYEKNLVIYFTKIFLQNQALSYNFYFKSPNVLYISESSKDPKTQYFFTLHFIPHELTSTPNQHYSLFQLKTNQIIAKSNKEIDNFILLGKISNILKKYQKNIINKINLENKRLHRSTLNKIVLKGDLINTRIYNLRKNKGSIILNKWMFNTLIKTKNLKIDWSDTPLSTDCKFEHYVSKTLNHPLSLTQEISIKHIQITKHEKGIFNLNLISTENLIYNIKTSDLNQFLFNLILYSNNYFALVHVLAVYYNDPTITHIS